MSPVVMAMSTLHLQSLIFSTLALLTIAFSLLLPPMTPQQEWILASGLIVLFGVPHGALDPLFAQDLLQLDSHAAWLAFVTLYLLLAALVVVLWWYAPLFFLVAFLSVSILHFSGDLVGGITFAERLVYGGGVITLPALRHSTELTRLFSQLVGADAAMPVVAVLQLISLPWLLALLVLVVLGVRRDGLEALQIMAVGLLTLIATPLLGFAIYFCAMHSARHILRTWQYAGVAPRQMVLVTLLPLLAVLSFSVLGWYCLPPSSVDERVLRLLFVTLAALTLPHMVLVERVRFANWQRRAGPSPLAVRKNATEGGCLAGKARWLQARYECTRIIKRLFGLR
jgi:beta-carotene 15,15'-dioxygenase